MLDYGIVGNCKTSALIKKNGSVDWMCFPTFSSPSVFAKILDSKKGGSLEIKTKGRYTIKQRYIPNTAILETLFTSEKFNFKVIDFFPRYRKLLKNKHAKLVRDNKLIRIIKPLKGTPEIKVIYNPKPNYARENCDLEESENIISCKNSNVGIGLLSNIPHETIRNSKFFELKSTFYLITGDKCTVSKYNVKKCLLLLSATKKYWERWVSKLILPEKNRNLIIRSAITLKLLTYSETGAVIAAATTSIPEEVGSERCWDYRYCWVRDSILCVDALKKIGRKYESKKLMEFIINLAIKNDFIQALYGINGETDIKEEELPHLAGFKNSKPVRIGNAAYNQIQHDIFGEILDLLYLYFVYYEHEKKITRRYWRFIKYTVNQIKFTWNRKDSGIWEFRDLYNHYTYSKFMSYIGVDRAIKIAEHFRREEHLEDWKKLREEIKTDILEKGYNKNVESFTISYGSNDLDASLLHMAYHEFLDKNDPRLINTINAIYNNLRQNEMVQRYTIRDDFGKSNSAFTICSFWLVEALYYIGEEKKARDLFKKLIKRSNHLGLFSEDIDIKTKKLIGNFPQAYTHIALINTSILLSEWSVKRKKF